MDSSLQKKLDLFFSQFRLVRFEEGETLFSADDSPPGIFYLRKGFVKEYIISEQGTELTIHIYGPLTHFPMMWAMSGVSNRHNFKAMTDLEVFLAPKDKVVKFFQEEPQLSFEFAKRLLSGLNGLAVRIETTTFGSTYTRVISALLYLIHRFGVKKGNKIVINHRFTHQEIASLIGVTREHVSLEIEKLLRDKLIAYQNRSITVPSIKKLERALTFSNKK